MAWQMLDKPFCGARIARAGKLALAAALLGVPALAAPSPATASNGVDAVAQALGQPDHIGYVVADLSATQQQVTAATGARFQVSSSPVTAQVTGDGTKQVTVKRAISTSGGSGPVLELMQVSDVPRQWLGDRDHPFLSYSVNSVNAYNRPFTVAGMSLVVSGKGFAFWQGKGGVMVRLIDNPADPAIQGETSAVDNAGDFGPPAALTLYPCDTAAVATQLGQALGARWRDAQSYTLPWNLADGSTSLLTSTSTISQQGGPFIGVESPHGFPGEDPCTSDDTPSYLIYATDVSAAGERFGSAGMQFIGAVPTLIAAYRGDGISLEAASPVFVPQ